MNLLYYSSETELNSLRMYLVPALEGASSSSEVFESLQTQIFLGPEAGSIIGRGGEVIKSIREESR